MGSKRVKLFGSGTIVHVRAIRLPNGSILIPQRTPEDREHVDWVEVAPGTPLYKRWSAVIVDEPDPRETPEYRAWKAAR